MEWFIVVGDVIILLGLGALALFARNYLPSYTKEKGKNLATREDIEEITDKIESVKTEYAKELEGLKSQLNAKFHAQTVRFEKEFHVYEKIWKALLEIKNSTVKLRPISDTVDSRVSEEDRKRERLERFGKAFDCFYPAVYENKPFFPPDIFTRLEQLLILMNVESHGYSARSPDPNHPLYDSKYFDTAEANAEKIREETEAICELMRQKIESL